MSGKAFFDTNVPLYLLSGDEERASRAEALLAGGGVISVQVLNEFAAVASRKLRMDWDEIGEVLAGVRAACEVVPLTEEVHALGLTIAARHRLAVYDAMIWAAAMLAGCEVIYSEDMQDGLRIDGTVLRNPFRSEA